MYVGRVIENALHERHKVGNESEPRYSLSQILAPDFRLPPTVLSPQSSVASATGLHALVAANPGMVGRWKQQAKEV